MSESGISPCSCAEEVSIAFQALRSRRLTISTGIYAYYCLLLTWVSNNLKPDYKRSVGVPLFASLANISGLVSSQNAECVH